MSELVKRLRDHYGDRVGVRRDMESAADRIEALEAVLRDVRAEINLHKSPKLAAKIDAALAPEQE